MYIYLYIYHGITLFPSNGWARRSAFRIAYEAVSGDVRVIEKSWLPGVALAAAKRRWAHENLTGRLINYVERRDRIAHTRVSLGSMEAAMRQRIPARHREPAGGLRRGDGGSEAHQKKKGVLLPTTLIVHYRLLSRKTSIIFHLSIFRLRHAGTIIHWKKYRNIANDTGKQKRAWGYRQDIKRHMWHAFFRKNKQFSPK